MPALPSIDDERPVAGARPLGQREDRGQLAVALEERPLARVHRRRRDAEPQLEQRLGPVEPRQRAAAERLEPPPVAEVVLDERRRRRRQQHLALRRRPAPTRAACSPAGR